MSGLDLGTGCTFKISLNNHELFRMPDDGTFVPFAPNASSAQFDTGSIAGIIDPPLPGSQLGQEIYSLPNGPKNLFLTLEVVTNGALRGPFFGGDSITINPDYVYPWLWFWEGATLASQDSVTVNHEWKESYQVAGTFRNSGACEWTFDHELEQIDQDGSSITLFHGQETVPTNLSSPLVSFPPIKQDWRWFLENVWVPVGPTTKQFRYRVAFTITDAYGNFYPTQFCSGYFVIVSVSDEKLALSDNAVISQASAGALAIASAILPWLSIAATAAGITAAVFGSYAEDPPEPDFRFRKLVIHSKFRFPNGAHADERLSTLIRFFELICNTVRYLEDLTKIEGRLMGARLKKDHSGLTIQKRSYRKCIIALLSESRELMPAAALASQSLANNKVFQTPALLAYVRGTKRIPKAQIDRLLRKTGLGKTGLTQTRKAFADVNLRKRLFSEQGFARLFTQMSVKLVNIVRRTEHQTNELLKTYSLNRIHRPNHANHRRLPH
jgi:hypothetical protein